MVVHSKLEARCSWLARAEGGITTRAMALFHSRRASVCSDVRFSPQKHPLYLYLSVAAFLEAFIAKFTDCIIPISFRWNIRTGSCSYKAIMVSRCSGDSFGFVMHESGPLREEQMLIGRCRALSETLLWSSVPLPLEVVLPDT